MKIKILLKLKNHQVIFSKPIQQNTTWKIGKSSWNSLFM